VAISPDGQWAATAAIRSGGVDVWDASNGEHVAILPHRGGYATVRFSPDGRWLVTNVRAEHRFWETGSWKLSRRIPRPPSTRTAVAFTSDGATVALLHGKDQVHLLNAATFEPLAILEAAGQPLACLSFTPDSGLLVGTYARGIQCWDLRRLRRQLRDMGLDWDPPLPECPDPQPVEPMTVEFAGPSAS
jgi:WD40 repeat protein